MTEARIFLSAPDVRDLERDYVMAAIDSNWIAPAGPDLDAFEVQLAEKTGRKHAVALSSGTAALHLALLNVGVEAGDEVFASTLTFVGSVSPIVHIGAHPVFIDSESTSWNLDPNLLSQELDRRSTEGSLPAAVVAVDLYGNPADYEAIVEICREHDVPLIEDAAESLGANHGLGPCGSFGTSAILSFNGNKITTSSGGGAYVTDSAEDAERARYLSTQARQAAVHYEHTEVGFNYRLSNILAALGRAQVERLEDRIARRCEIYTSYSHLVAELDHVDMLTPPPWGTGNHWLSCLQIGPESKSTPKDLIEALSRQNIESRPIWKPMHLQPVFENAEAVLNGTSERIFTQGICLPSGSGMDDADLERVLMALKKELS